MEIELSGPNLDEQIDEELFARWKPLLNKEEQHVYRTLHDLINDGFAGLDAKMLARECRTTRNHLFTVVLPRLRSLGLCEFGSDDD